MFARTNIFFARINRQAICPQEDNYQIIIIINNNKWLNAQWHHLSSGNLRFAGFTRIMDEFHSWFLWMFQITVEFIDQFDRFWLFWLKLYLLFSIVWVDWIWYFETLKDCAETPWKPCKVAKWYSFLDDTNQTYHKFLNNTKPNTLHYSTNTKKFRVINSGTFFSKYNYYSPTCYQLN